jgi:hypothetical protein
MGNRRCQPLVVEIPRVFLVSRRILLHEAPVLASVLRARRGSSLDRSHGDEDLVVRVAEIQLLWPKVASRQTMEECRGGENVAVRLDPQIAFWKSAFERAACRQ